MPGLNRHNAIDFDQWMQEVELFVKETTNEIQSIATAIHTNSYRPDQTLQLEAGNLSDAENGPASIPPLSDSFTISNGHDSSTEQLAQLQRRIAERIQQKKSNTGTDQSLSSETNESGIGFVESSNDPF